MRVMNVLVLAGCLGFPACASSGAVGRNVASLSTQELCDLRLVEGNFQSVIAELERRRAFSDAELAQIRGDRVEPGMGVDAVRCALGAPRQVITQTGSREFDTLFVYGAVQRSSRPLGETRVYFSEDRVVRRDDQLPSGTAFAR